MPKPLLLARPSGIFARFFVPADLRQLIGRRWLVRRLRVFNPDAARLIAARMGYAFRQVIDAHRAGEAAVSKKLIDDVLAAAASGELRHYEVAMPGGLTIRADGPEDHARALEAIGRIQMVMAPGVVPSGSAPGKAIMLHAALNQFLTNFIGTAAASATKLETEHSVHLFRDLTDDMRLREVGSEQIDAFRAAVAHWPTHARVKPAFRSLSAREIVRKAQTMGSVPKITSRTIDKHLDRLRVFFNAAIKRKEIDHNPLANVRLTPPTQKYIKKRRAFRSAELQKIFDPERRAKECSADAMKFWMPLLGLFVAARIEELAQLTVHDLEHNKITGIWGININSEDDKRTKNAQSTRFVPLPDRLMALGLVAYRDDVQAMGFEALIPGGSETSKNGPGDRASKWFNRTYLDKSCGLTNPALVFHAFRNTQQTAADHLGITEAQVAPISGHAHRSIQSRHYIDPATLVQRKDCIDRIADSFELPPLTAYRPGQFGGYFMKVAANARHADSAAKRKRGAGGE